MKIISIAQLRAAEERLNYLKKYNDIRSLSEKEQMEFFDLEYEIDKFETERLNFD